MTVWFEAAWLMTVSKQGLSAQNLQRVTDLGSYQTAWTMLHKLRTVMTSADRRPLSGRIEVDETYVGGSGKPGPTGRGAAGKVVVAGAIERRGRGFGRARLGVACEKVKYPTLASCRASEGPASSGFDVVGVWPGVVAGEVDVFPAQG